MKKNIFQWVISICMTLILGFSPEMSWGIKADRTPRQVELPDGSRLTVRLHGDEFFHYTTTSDGYMIARKKDGYYYYASYASDGKLVYTNVRAHDPSNRTGEETAMLAVRSKGVTMNMATTSRQKGMMNVRGGDYSVMNGIHPYGNHKTLVILAEFQDVRYSISSPKESFSDMLNTPGYSENGATGSAADYFKDNSGGKFSPEFVVVGPVLLPKEMGFYGENKTATYEPNARQMIIDACQIAAEQGLVNFKEFDSDNDGIVDNVYVFYAGYDEAAAGAPEEAVWAHEGTLKGMAGNVIDGVELNTYACSSELKNSSGKEMVGIGTICHEFGHVLGLPDFYDTDGVVGGESVALYEHFSIMDGGSYNNEGRTPPYYTVVERAIIGWLEPEELQTEGKYTLGKISENKGYRISAPSTKGEYFLIENRQQEGWDKYLPAHGMIVYHIDRSSKMIKGTPIADLWRTNKLNTFRDHPCCYILGAAGNITSGDPSEAELATVTFPGARQVTEFSRNSSPASTMFWNPMEKAGVNLLNIQENAGVVSFDVEVVNSTKITGKVLTKNGAGVGGATMTWIRMGKEGEAPVSVQTQTDGAGNFAIKNDVEVGEYMVLVNKGGFRNYSRRLNVTKESSDFQLLMTEVQAEQFSELRLHNETVHSFWNLPKNFIAAASWSGVQLEEYAGMNLAKAEIHVLGEGACTLHIWENGTEILKKGIKEIPEGGWVSVDLMDENIILSAEKELKIGFEFADNTNLLLGMDKGPMASTGGLVKYQGEWLSVREIADVDQNWMISALLVAGENALLIDAGQRDATLRWPREVGVNSWKLQWKKKGDVNFNEETVATARYVLSPLQPDTEYTVRLAAIRNGEEGEFREQEFRTEALTSDYAVITGIRSSYVLGESIALRVRNIQADIEKIEWRLDGKIVSGNRVTPTIGEHELSVRIFTKDKGVEDISRIFVVTPKN